MVVKEGEPMLNDLKVSTRLYILIVLLCSSAVFIGYLGLSTARETNDALNSVYNDRVLPLKQIKEVSDLYAVDIVDTANKVSKGIEDWELGATKVRQALIAIDETWNTYLNTKLVKEEKETIDRIRPLKSHADESVRHLISLLTGKDINGLNGFVQNELYKNIDPLSGELKNLIEIQLTQTEATYHYSTESYASSLNHSIIIIAAALIISITFGYIISKSITNPLLRGVKALDSLAAGDLTIDVNVSGSDELAQLMTSMKRMCSSLRKIVSQLINTSSQVSSAASELRAVSENIATGAEEVSCQATEVATAGEEMSVTASSIAQNCQMAADSAQHALDTANIGVVVVGNTVSAMKQIQRIVLESSESIERLGARSDQIGSIVSTIENIAAQTNLLALNAAIEAARAGEQGRGFAVVADEVRTLAARTSQSTKEISEMIKSIQHETYEAVDLMKNGVTQVDIGATETERSGAALGKILDQVQAVALQVSQIATAAEEQTVVTSEIAGNMQQITDVVKETSQGAQESAAAAVQLDESAEELRELVNRFKI